MGWGPGSGCSPKDTHSPLLRVRPLQFIRRGIAETPRPLGRWGHVALGSKTSYFRSGN